MTAARTDGRPHVAVAAFHDLHVISVVAPDRPGLLADIAGTLASFRLSVRSALVRTLAAEASGGPGVAVDTWYVDGDAVTLPEAATLETALRRLADGDTTVLDRLARRDAGYRPPSAAAAEPRAVLLNDASAEATVLEVRAADRPGLLHALASALTMLGIDIRSAHVATHAGQAVDVLYVSEPGGTRLTPGRVGAAIAVLVDAAGLPASGG